MLKNEKNTKIALIATLPKSAAWYLHTFFWCYDQLLQNSSKFFSKKFYPDLAAALQNDNISKLETFKESLGLDKLFVCHTICPGFEESNDKRFAMWKTLRFPFVGYNWGENYLREIKYWERLQLENNSQAKIIYVYRNPLDHFVSFYHHAQNHIDDNHRYKTLLDGSRIPITNLHNFIFQFGILNSFIKHYYSFKQMQLMYPDKILLIPYETLVTSPHQTFSRILDFIDATPDTDDKRELYEVALSMCSKEALMKIEEKYNISLAHDQIQGQRHIRGGDIGKWKTELLEDELEAIELTLNMFDISLKDFILVDEKLLLDQPPWFANITSPKKYAEIFAYQLSEAGQQLIDLEQESKKLLECEYVTSLEKQLKQAQHEIKMYSNSKSWRMTAPLRRILYLARKLKIEEFNHSNTS